MSEEWKAGMLALCVKGGPIHPKGSYSEPDSGEYPITGRIYKVSRVGMYEFFTGNTLALWLENGPINSDGANWGSHRFVPIPPHIPDAEDEETIRLYRSKPIPVTVEVTFR